MSTATMQTVVKTSLYPFAGWALEIDAVMPERGPETKYR